MYEGGGGQYLYGCLVVPNGSFLNVFYALNYGARLTSIYNISETFYFPIFLCIYRAVHSKCVHHALTVPSLVFSSLLFALIIQKALTVHPQSVHRSAFINQLILYLG